MNEGQDSRFKNTLNEILSPNIETKNHIATAVCGIKYVSEEMRLEQIFEFFVGEPGVADYAFERVWVEPRMTWNRELSPSIRHASMLAARSHKPKANLLKSFYGAGGRDVGEQHRTLSECNFNFLNFSVFQLSPLHLKIGQDRIFDVRTRFSLGSSLTMTTGECRSTDVIAIFAFVYNYEVFHSRSLAGAYRTVNRTLSPAEIKQLYLMGK